VVVAQPLTNAKAPSPDGTAAVWSILCDVADPEIPVLSIVDLGIVRYVRWTENGELRVGLTPTYSGCPATDVIRSSVLRALNRAGYAGARIDTVISPPWTSDWLSAEGRQKLVAYGIAPPSEAVSNPLRLFGDPLVACPRCSSKNTERVSEFGSTPCKAHYRCTDCLEPFDYFKCI
jgi:ring-1,2-phenylacetyl-CoA epoxidase subunit PaaD